MSRAALWLALALAGGAWASSPGKATESLTVLFTGDNGGEIAPCG
jgi:hypothetical protein